MNSDVGLYDEDGLYIPGIRGRFMTAKELKIN
jgi:hypothetical protein